MLAVLRLSSNIALLAPRTRYPAAGQPYRGGIPTRLITRPCPAALQIRFSRQQFGQHAGEVLGERTLVAAAKGTVDSVSGAVRAEPEGVTGQLV